METLEPLQSRSIDVPMSVSDHAISDDQDNENTHPTSKTTNALMQPDALNQRLSVLVQSVIGNPAFAAFVHPVTGKLSNFPHHYICDPTNLKFTTFDTRFTFCFTN